MIGAELEWRSAAGLHWLAFLLTGRREIAADVAVETIASRDQANPFLSDWMLGWARRIVISKAVAAVRDDLAASVRRTSARRVDASEIPPRSWALDRSTTRTDLEEALLAIDIFPRVAVLLLVFEGMPLNDAAILLDAGPDLVLKAQAAGLRALTIQLAKTQGWTAAAERPRIGEGSLQHA